MDTISLAIGSAGTALLAVTLVGMLVRGRWASWYSFAAYVAAVTASSLAFLAWPSLYNEDIWAVHVNVVNVLRFAVALELAARTFRAFPGARSALRPVLLAVLLVTLALVSGVSGADLDYRTFLREQQPRLLNGSVWLYTAIAGLILWYRLPIARFPKTVLLSYVPYLFFELVYLHVFVERGWEVHAVGYANQAAYLVLAAWWAWAAWRLDPPSRPGSTGDPSSLPDPDRITYSVPGAADRSHRVA